MNLVGPSKLCDKPVIQALGKARSWGTGWRGFLPGDVRSLGNSLSSRAAGTVLSNSNRGTMIAVWGVFTCLDLFSTSVAPQGVSLRQEVGIRVDMVLGCRVAPSLWCFLSCYD